MSSANVQIYTTSTCGYCRRALALLKRLDVPFQQHDVSGKPEVRKWLVQQTGRTTVPQIFINDTSIGGYDDLALLERRGQLQGMLSQPPSPSDAT